MSILMEYYLMSFASDSVTYNFLKNKKSSVGFVIKRHAIVFHMFQVYMRIIKFMRNRVFNNHKRLQK